MDKIVFVPERIVFVMDKTVFGPDKSPKLEKYIFACEMDGK